MVDCRRMNYVAPTDACYTEYDLECALARAGQLNETDRLRLTRGRFDDEPTGESDVRLHWISGSLEEVCDQLRQMSGPNETDEDAPARPPTPVLYDWEWGITADEVRERIEELRHKEEDNDES